MIVSKRQGLVLQATAIDRYRIFVLYKRFDVSNQRVWSIYHINTKKWTDLPMFPAHQYQIGPIPMFLMHQGCLYAITVCEGVSTLWRMNMIGSKSNDCVGEVNKSFVRSLKWEKIEKNSFELSLIGFSAVSVINQNVVYISGGYGCSDENRDHFETKDVKGFIPTTSNETLNSSLLTKTGVKWKRCPNMPRRRRDHTSVIVDNKIYLFGGYGQVINRSSIFERAVDVYDICTNTWSTAPDIPANLIIEELSALVFKDRWIVLVSYDGNNPCFILDTKLHSWFEGGIQRERGKNTNSYSVMPGHIRLNLVALEDTNDIIVIGHKHKQQHEDYSNFTMQCIPFLYLHPWLSIGEYVLLRRLVHDGRATPCLQLQKQYGNLKKTHYAIIQSLILDMNEDMFRTILSFLTYVRFQ